MNSILKDDPVEIVISLSVLPFALEIDNDAFHPKKVLTLIKGVLLFSLDCSTVVRWVSRLLVTCRVSQREGQAMTTASCSVWTLVHR